jgi:hypothetical protein
MVARNVSILVVTNVWQTLFVSFFLNEVPRDEDDNETHKECWEEQEVNQQAKSNRCSSLDYQLGYVDAITMTARDHDKNVLSCSSRLTSGTHIEADKIAEVVQTSERLLLDESIGDKEFGNFVRGCLIPPVIIGLAKMLVIRYSYRTATRTSATNDPDGMQKVVKSFLEAGKARNPVAKAQDKLVDVHAVLGCLGPCEIGYVTVDLHTVTS